MFDPLASAAVNPSCHWSTEAVVREVNVVAREILASTAAGEIAIDVPCDCPIMLRGQRIKLRLVQPGDSVAVSLVTSAGRYAASRVLVQPEQAPLANSKPGLDER
jgi:hypothetical protein